MTTNNETVKVHVFEAAGLGKAPFRFVGMEHKVGPVNLGGGLTCGAPGQPMGTCDFCGNGIAFCYYIRSSDGREFIVGSECVRKTGDAGLKRKVAKLETQRRNEAADARIERARETLEDKGVQAKLAGKPHPNPHRAGKGDSLLDYVEWLIVHGGRTGQTKAARYIEGAR